MCKRGDTFSLAVLIGRGLDFVSFRSLLFFLCSVFRVCLVYAPLAQLVEHLTLNQGVQGSSPWWCTISGPLVKRLRHRPLTAKTGVRFSYGSPKTWGKPQEKVNNCDLSYSSVGVYYAEGPPVPIPNTVVKLTRAENTWRAASREDRSTPTSFKTHLFWCVFCFYVYI